MEFSNPKTSLQRVRKLLDYNPETGVFTRKMTRMGWPAGKVAGALVAQGYRLCCVDREYVLAHRLAWFYVYGVWPSIIDHINQDKDDNSIANLREVSISENRQNVARYKNNTSGHKGVHWFKANGKWQAQIKHENKRYHLGFFEDIEDAVSAYAAAAARLHKFNPEAVSA